MRTFMRKFKLRALIVGGALLMAAAAATPANALTLAFDTANPGDTTVTDSGFFFSPTRIVNGNCNIKPCLALNDNEMTTLTMLSPGTFTLTDFWYQLLGVGKKVKGTLINNSIIVDTYGTSGFLATFILAVPGITHNTPHLFSEFIPPQPGLTKVVFRTDGGGNVRIDDIIASPTPSPVPLPAALPLLFTGLAGLGLLRSRRRKLEG